MDNINNISELIDEVRLHSARFKKALSEIPELEEAVENLDILNIRYMDSVVDEIESHLQRS